MKKVLTFEVLVEALPNWETKVMPPQAIAELETRIVESIHSTSRPFPEFPWVMQVQVTDRRDA